MDPHCTSAIFTLVSDIEGTYIMVSELSQAQHVPEIENHGPQNLV